MVPRETIGPAPSQPATPPQPDSFLPLSLPRAPELFQRRGLRGGWGPGSPPPIGNRKNHSWDIRFQGKSETPGGGPLPGSPIFFFKQNRVFRAAKGIELPRALPQPAFKRPFLAIRALGFLVPIALIKATCVYLHIGILRPPVTRPCKTSRREEAGPPGSGLGWTLILEWARAE